MDVSKSKILLWVYAVLTGMSLSMLGFVYSGASIARTFLITSSVFGAMSIYGYTTKKDLTSFGSFLFMGMIGLLIASLVNIFIQSSALYFSTSIIGVLIFTGLIAWNVQRIKSMYFIGGGGEMGKRLAIVGAFSLYLDFINLFLYMLRFLGTRKE
jgi:FtsH-binding integral membrane protein